MPYEQPTSYNESLTGTPGWRQYQLHDIAQRARNLFSDRAKQGPREYIGTVAPRNDLQKSAKEHLKKVLKQNEIADARYDQSKQNLDKFAKQNTHQTVSPRIQTATRSPFSADDAEIMRHFKGAYSDIGKAIQEEMAENYQKNIAPNVNYAYMANGLWNSGSRNKHNREVIKNLHKDIARELTKVKGQGLRESLEHVGQHKERNLQAAQLEANVLQKDKEAGIHAEKAIQDTERAKLLHNIAVNEQHRSLGAEEQAQKEAELRDKEEESRYLDEAKIRDLTTEAAIANAQPVPIQFARSKAPEPRPISGAQVAGGTLSSVIGQMFPQGKKAGGKISGLSKSQLQVLKKIIDANLVHKKTGGSIKKYAPGGPITVTPPAGTLSPELEQAMALMQENRQNKSNPTGKAFSALGAHLLGTVGQNPLHSLGQGLEKFHHAQSSHENENMAENMRQIDVLNAVHNSRQQQENIIRDFELKKAQMAEQAKLYAAQIGNSNAHANLLRAQTEQLRNPRELGGMSGYLPRGVKETEAMKQEAKTNASILKSLASREQAANKILKRTDILGKTFDKKDLVTGPNIGAISNIPGIGQYVAGWAGLSPEDKQTIQMEGKGLALEAEALHPGAKGVQLAELFQETKPSEVFEKSVNQAGIKRISNEALRTKAEVQFIRQFVKDGYGNALQAQEAFAEMYPEGTEDFTSSRKESAKELTMPTPEQAAAELAKRRGR